MDSGQQDEPSLIDEDAVLAYLERAKTKEELCDELDITHTELLEIFRDRIDFMRYQDEALGCV